MDRFSDVLWNKCVIGLAEINKSGVFIKANPAFCNLLGYNENELQDKHWEEVTHPEDAEGSKEMLTRCLAGEISGYTMESRYLTKRGNIIWVNLHVSSLLDDTGNIKCLLKQVTNTPIILPIEKKEVDTKIDTKNNYTLLIASGVGCLLIALGVYFKEVELKGLGIALVSGLFGGILIAKNKKQLE